MFYYYNIDRNTLFMYAILFILAFVIDFITELIKFKQFAKKYYDLDIHLISFTKDLIYSKLKKTR